MIPLPHTDGLLYSRVFPGLRLPVAPLLAGDTAKVLAALSHEAPETSVKSEASFTTAELVSNSRLTPQPDGSGGEYGKEEI
jgi:hypothetical protein